MSSYFDLFGSGAPSTPVRGAKRPDGAGALAPSLYPAIQYHQTGRIGTLTPLIQGPYASPGQVSRSRKGVGIKTSPRAYIRAAPLIFNNTRPRLDTAILNRRVAQARLAQPGLAAGNYGIAPPPQSNFCFQSFTPESLVSSPPRISARPLPPRFSNILGFSESGIANFPSLLPSLGLSPLPLGLDLPRALPTSFPSSAYLDPGHIEDFLSEESLANWYRSFVMSLDPFAPPPPRQAAQAPLPVSRPMRAVPMSPQTPTPSKIFATPTSMRPKIKQPTSSGTPVMSNKPPNMPALSQTHTATFIGITTSPAIGPADPWATRPPVVGTSRLNTDHQSQSENEKLDKGKWDNGERNTAWPSSPKTLLARPDAPMTSFDANPGRDQQGWHNKKIRHAIRRARQKAKKKEGQLGAELSRMGELKEAGGSWR